MQEGTTSRVTVANRPYCECYDFYSVSLENFEYHLVFETDILLVVIIWVVTSCSVLDYSLIAKD